MKKIICSTLLAIFLALSTQTIALEVDKEKHLAAGIVLGVVDWKFGCGVGALKEAHDERYGGMAEFQDFAYTCLGSTITHVIGRDKSPLYKAAAAIMILDGISTSGVMRNPYGYETNPLWVGMFGERPTDGEILVMTAINLAALELTEMYLPPLSRTIAQIGIIWTRYRVVQVNFEIARW